MQLTKQTEMKYKTIVLELLRQRTRLYEELRTTRRLLPSMESWAEELKASHQAWEQKLRQAAPSRDSSQLASEALELAVKELEDRLRSASPAGGNEMLSSNQAVAFVKDHTSQG